MAVLRYTIDLGPEPWTNPLVHITGSGVDDDASDAIANALGPLTVWKSISKGKIWLERWLNYRGYSGDDGEDAFTLPPERLRQRFRAFLQSYGCSFKSSTRKDGSYDVVRETGSSKDIGLVIAAVRRFYWGLQNCFAYGPRDRATGEILMHWPNPLSTNGYDENAGGRAQEQTKAGRQLHKMYAGNQFVVSEPDWVPPRITDPAGYNLKFIAAARADGWPSTPLVLLYLMDDDGPRSSDARECDAFDWAEASFGRALHAPNKNSKRNDDGRRNRVKWIVTSDRTRNALIEAVDQRHREEPSYPNFEMLQAMAAEEKWAALKAVPLFPNRFGKAMGHSGFLKWFKPTMEKHGVLHKGKVVWPHLGRHANITERVISIYQSTRPGRERDARLQKLRDELGFKSDQLALYAWEAIRNEAIKIRSAEQDARNAAKHPGDAPAGVVNCQYPTDIADDLEEMDP